MKKQPLKLNQARCILEGLYSDCDPIIYKGKETSIDELSMNIDDKNAGSIKIKFWGEKQKLISGTVLGMVKNRSKDYRI